MPFGPTSRISNEKEASRIRGKLQDALIRIRQILDEATNSCFGGPDPTQMRSSVFRGDHYIVSPVRISEGILRNLSGSVQPR